MKHARAQERTETQFETRYYAVGDIHGRADLLAKMHKLIVEDLREYAGALTLVYLGDYVDRGATPKACWGS